MKVVKYHTYCRYSILTGVYLRMYDSCTSWKLNGEEHAAFPTLKHTVPRSFPNKLFSKPHGAIVDYENGLRLFQFGKAIPFPKTFLDFIAENMPQP